jgi:protein-tyrosine-phosphatase
MVIPSTDRPIHVLILCTGNSARSVLAEATLNHLAKGRFRAWSAGSRPAGRVNPAAIAQLEASGIMTTGLRSKSWDEFARDDAPVFDLVITVCDSAAGEVCPLFLGAPVRTHWGQPDPAAVESPPEAVAMAFREAHDLITRRLDRLLDLPLASIPRAEWRIWLDPIGRASA